jgi:hypothetical protein
MKKQIIIMLLFLLAQSMVSGHGIAIIDANEAVYLKLFTSTRDHPVLPKVITDPESGFCCSHDYFLAVCIQVMPGLFDQYDFRNCQ